MNENAKLWVDALRSGKYEQSSDILGGPETGYCCLGVACKVYEEATGDILPKNARGLYISDIVEDVAVGLAEDYGKVRRWLNLYSDVGRFKSYEKLESTMQMSDHYKSLVVLNDDRSWTFDQIADIIEKEYDDLFDS